VKSKLLNKKFIVAFSVVTNILVGVIIFYAVDSIEPTVHSPNNETNTILNSYTVKPADDDAKEIEESEAEPRTDAKILIFGDTAFLDPLGQEIIDGKNPLANVEDKFMEYDYVVGNHEATIDGESVGSPQEGKPYTFTTPKVSAQVFKNAGVDAFSYANNHTKDYGPASVIHTIELLNEVGIKTFGAGANSTKAFEPLVIDINGNKIGFLGYNCAEYAFNWARPNEAGTAYYNEGLIRNSITSTKAQVDIVIVMPHCGTEHQTTPNEIQNKWAKVFTNAGADFVIGSHPHVRQAPEIVNGVTVVHSVGNFMLPGQSHREEARKGWVVELIIDNRQILEYNLIETIMDDAGRPSWV
jgi:hypothetical protein